MKHALLVFLLCAINYSCWQTHKANERVKALQHASNERIEALQRANKELVEGYFTANADVAIRTDEKTGDVLVRINGIHYHLFQKACLKPLI